jgi:hypothetical protein
MSDLLNKASLVVIPSGYKEDTVYSVVPSDGSGDLSFTRASNGTRVNSAGLVEVCPWNLVQYSEGFDNAAWSKLGATVTANDITAPNGTLTADKVVFSGANNSIYQAVSLNGEIATRFVYIKGTAGETISIDDIYVSQPNITLTGDWQLIGFTSATPSLRGFGISTYGGATARTIWLWGAQVNIGSTAKPYFPTTDRLNVPRLTYQNGGGGCPSLLLEKQSTNIATYSEDATQWNKGSNVGSITVTADQTISPDGTQNADKVQFPAVGSGSQYAVLFFPFTASATTYTGSVWLKGENGGEVVWINFTKDGVNYTQTLCTLTTSWQRFTLSSTLTSGADNFQIGVDTRDSAESAKPAQTIYVWGRQLEASSYVTTLIPTTSASATRVADACFKTGISSLIGQTEGVLFADFEFVTGAMDNPIIIRDSAFSTYVYINQQTSGNIWGQVAGVGNFNFVTSATNGRYKCAIAYKSGNSAFFVNGAQVGSTNTTTFTPATMTIFEFLTPALIQVNQAVLFKTRLTNAELASLTTI